MSVRAAIYVRTTSETQGGKSSPSEQESDCQTLAKERGLQVVRVYRDVEKHRVGNRLVEPSGGRSDRPGLLAMPKTLPKINSMSSSPGARTDCIGEYERC
jgi:DNA invertase Pin-like site-specific DNA recombinase